MRQILLDTDAYVRFLAGDERVLVTYDAHFQAVPGLRVWEGE